MTHAVVTELTDGFFAEIKGHSGSAPKGEDLVCAAVSALTVTVFDKLDELASEGQISYRARCLADGYAFLDFVWADDPFAIDRAQTVMDVLYRGLRWISDENPGCLELE